MPEPTLLKKFNDLLLERLPRPEWSHSNGNRDFQVEPQFGSATRISHNSNRANPLNSNYALIYFSQERIIIRSHGLKQVYLGKILAACKASAAPGQEVEVL